MRRQIIRRLRMACIYRLLKDMRVSGRKAPHIIDKLGLIWYGSTRVEAADDHRLLVRRTMAFWRTQLDGTTKIKTCDAFGA